MLWCRQAEKAADFDSAIGSSNLSTTTKGLQIEEPPRGASWITQILLIRFYSKALTAIILFNRSKLEICKDDYLSLVVRFVLRHIQQFLLEILI